MRIRTLLAVLSLAALLLGLTACGGGGGLAQLPLQGGTPRETQELLPDLTRPAATEAQEPALPAPKGADSVKALLACSLDYFHSGCDYSKIAEVHDPRAYLAYFMMEDFYEDEDLSLDQAMEKAALLYGSAEELQRKDPELAAMVMEELDVEDPKEALDEYMRDLRDAFRSGEISTADPNYDRLSQMLTDWDKGADYILEHYPELLAAAQERGIVFSLDGALELLQRYARFEIYNNDLKRFASLETEYRPENTNVGEDGICSYDMGSIVDGSDVWMLDLLYYVEEARYYLIGYSVVVGSTGG